MAVALVERVPVDRITRQAKDVHFWRLVATLLAGLLWVLGWAAARTCAVAWRAIAWAAVAVQVGWSDARRPDGGGS